jgi:hypothetical protein
MSFQQVASVAKSATIAALILGFLAAAPALAKRIKEPAPEPTPEEPAPPPDPPSSNPRTAHVVAMDQVLTYNRMTAFAPTGMIYALARDVFPKGTLAGDQTYGNSCAAQSCSPGNVQLRDNKRPRPLTLRVNEGDELHVTFTNLLRLLPQHDAKNEAPGIQLCEPVDGAPRPALCQSEQPATRNAGFHVYGAQWVTGPSDDGSKVGGQNSLVPPGGTTTYKIFLEKEGAYVVAAGPNQGGEGGSGALANGLFGIVNVEPPGSTSYRSQLTREEMVMAADLDGDLVLEEDPDGYGGYPSELTSEGHPKINYEATYPAGHPYDGSPILNIHQGMEIVHSDLNAVIVGPGPGGTFPTCASGCADLLPGELYPNRGEPFREFTIAFHDEVKIVQAYPVWYQQLAFTLGSVKDGFAINYGTGGIGSEIIGNRLGVGPMHECVDCKYEEFFLTSWAVGDPAMIVDVPANHGLEALAPGDTPPPGTQGPKATKAFYPDDPSNVWHGYLNDRTKIRNIHVGTEHHIFHLHAHQWLFASRDDNSNYLDAQAIGPYTAFTYEITYGGGGNRNKTAGDSIFHCHFYPHFAQGMWGLWRVHDTFEQGSLLDGDGRVLERGLLDAEICVDGQGNPAPGPAGGTNQCGGYLADGTPVPGGTPVPALVPLPGKGMAPLPGSFVASVDDDDDAQTPEVDVPFMGYPFYIAGVIGHRPPTPPLDLVVDGGIPRHVITGGEADAVQTPTDFDKILTVGHGLQIPETGTPEEKAAMAFHGPQAPGSEVYHNSVAPDGLYADFEVNGLPAIQGAPYAEPCRSDAYDGNGVGNLIGNPRFYAGSVVQIDADLNKVGWHFGQYRILVLDDDVAATLAGTRAPEPFLMRANTRDCVDYNHTNLTPNVYQLDDFQVKTPTDVIGQHIHLVKFDVTSADGAANGWNYEDGTMSPDEMAERIHALEAEGGSWAHWDGSSTPTPLGDPGPRTTRQRWYIDPGWRGNVFTHDHYGPSTVQQVGLYATVLVEPEGSTWSDPVSGEAFGVRSSDGGPTSWRADIDCAGCTGANADLAGDAWREFYLEFADFQLMYRSAEGDGAGFLNGPEQAINPSYRNEPGLPHVLLPKDDPLIGFEGLVPGCGNASGPGAWTGCAPEAISAADPGGFVVNYRNEPLPLRLRNPLNNDQANSPIDLDGDGIPDTNSLAGDLSWAFSSAVTRADPRLNEPPENWPYPNATAIQGALQGDPFTPMLRAYRGDKIHLRIQVGATEEGHNFNMNGLTWLQQWASPNSGFRSTQMAGISEYFILRVPEAHPVDGVFEDYMYQTGASVDAQWNGSWGLLRAYDDVREDLIPLPTNPVQGPGNFGRNFRGVCPRDADTRMFSVHAVQAKDVLPGGTLRYNTDLDDPTALIYVMERDLEELGEDEFGKMQYGKLKADRRVEPLILRARAGECIQVELTNRLPAVLHGPDPDFPGTKDLAGFNTMPMIVNEFNANDIAPSSHVGLHPQLVTYDVWEGDGMNVGFNPVQTASPDGGTVSYSWYAGNIVRDENGDFVGVPVEFGATNLMASDPIKGSSKGLIGALIIVPRDAVWNDGTSTTMETGKGRDKMMVTVTKKDGDVGVDGLLTRAAVDIYDSNETFLFRDVVMVMQDDVNMRFSNDLTFDFTPPVMAGDPVPTVSAEEEPEDSGMKAINYMTDPIWLRLGIGPTAKAAVTTGIDFTNAFAITGDPPQMPIYTAPVGKGLRVRFLKPGGHNRNSVPVLHGHLWARHPFNADSTEIDGNAEKTFWHAEQQGHGPKNHVNAVPLHGAGGKNGVPGDYLHQDGVPVHAYNGIWAILRVE